MSIEPRGYQLLIKPYVTEEKTAGGIIKPDMVRDKDDISSVVAQVVDMGPDAYSDVDKFPNGPWAKKRDWVLIGKHVGTRFKFKGVEFRFIDDDKVLGVTIAPEEVTRIM